MPNLENKCNRVYCIHVPGHDSITFSFRSFSFLIGWGVYGPIISGVKSCVLGRQRPGFQARSKDQEILEEGGGAGPSLLPRRDHE